MILIESAHTLFDLWFDKTGSPYYTSDEKDLFIKQGVYHFINKHFNEGKTHVAERTIRDVEDLDELIYPFSARTDSQGRLYDSVSETALNGREIMYVLNASRASSTECGGEQLKARYVRHNDYLSQVTNSYKKPTEKYPIHRIFNGYTKFDPSGEANVAMTVLVKPLSPTLDDPTNSSVRGLNAVDIELPEEVTNELVYLALRQAGVSVREIDFYQMVSGEEKINE